MGVPQMKEIASLIARAIKDGADESKASAIRADVNALTAQFPVYPRS
jgi:glycine/serine hydroxymethyltransferase